MKLFYLIILFSSISFMAYGIEYLRSPHMKNEFKRFGLEKLGGFTVILEVLGAIGLIVGIWINALLLIASFGLGLLMLLGVLVRLKMKDSLWISLPAIFYMSLNFFIFYKSYMLMVST